jgi:signal transduction histidine kinase
MNDRSEQFGYFAFVQQKYLATKMSHPAESNQLAYQLIKMMRISVNARSLLSEMTRTIGQTFRADRCLFVASASFRPRIQASFWDGNESSELPFKVTKDFFSHPIIAEILAKTKPLEIAELQANKTLSATDWLETMSVRSLLGITTYFQDNANGIIMVGYLQPHQWTTEEYEWLEVAAEVGAIASHVAQLEKVTKVNTDKTFSPEGSPLFKRWYDLTHQQLEQQRQLNQLKDEIITAISDRARNPLASMKLAMEMLSKERSQPLPLESEARYWEILKQEWQRLKDLIDNIVTLKKLESHEVSVNLETVTLQPLISELVQSFQGQWQKDKRKQLTLVEAIDAPLSVYTDPQHLSSILRELLINAGNFASPGTTVSLSVREEEDRVAIAITNIGRALSKQEQAYIFEPFRRGENAIEQSIPGVGLGLSLVKKLVELLNGKIELASNSTEDIDTQTISFTLTLPQSRDRQP